MAGISHSVISKNIWDFDPTSIGGCNLWLDGADRNTLFSDTAGTTQATVGGSVARWNDKSISRNNATQSTVENRPVLASNGSIQLTQANSHHLTIGNAALLPTGANNATYFVVTQRDPVATQTPSIFSYGNGADSQARTIYDRGSAATTGVIFVGGVNAIRAFNPVTSGVINTLSHITTFVVNNYIGSGWYNGVPFTTNSQDFQDTTTQLNTGTGFAFIGRHVVGLGAGLTFYGGNIYEILVYNSTLSNTDRQIIEGYLAWKWGLQSALPSSHPYNNNALTPQFTPTQLGNCSLWLDASQITGSNGSSVTSWPDRSGNSNNAIGTVAPVLAVNSVNNRNAVLLNGTTQYFDITTPSGLPNGSTSSSIFTVSQPSRTSTNPQMIFAHGGVSGTGAASNNTRQIFYSNLDNNFLATNVYTQPSGGDIDNVTIPPGKAAVTSTIMTTVNNSFRTGNAFSTNNISVSGINIGTLFGNIGRGFIGLTPSFYYGGYVCEIIVYSGALSDIQRQQIEGYLAWKWGVQGDLPSNHPYALANYFYTNTRPLSRNFNPTDLSDCVMWYDGADLTTMFQNTAGTTPVTGGGQSVALWRDKSGRGNDISNSGGTDRPVLTTTSLNPRGFNMVFNGSNQSFSRNGLVNNSNTYTKFLVFNRNSTTAGGFQRLFAYSVIREQFSPDLSGFHVQFNGSQTVLELFKSFNGGAFTITTNTYFIATIVATPFSMSLFLNGSTTAAATVTYTTAAPLTTPNFNGTNFRLGTSTAFSQPWPGFINECISYNRQLSTYEYQEVEGYLAWKWGMRSSLPTTHPFFRFPPPTITPVQPELQLYKPTFDPSDLNPTLWLDAQDTTSMSVDTDGRVMQWNNKGTSTNTPWLVSSANISNTNGNTSLGVLTGPFLTTSPVGSSQGIRYLDFSPGGSFPVTACSLSAGATASLTVASYASDNSITFSASPSTAFTTSQSISFATGFGNVVANTLYFIQSVIATNRITISNVRNGSVFTLGGTPGVFTSAATQYATSQIATLTIGGTPSATINSVSSTSTTNTITITSGTMATTSATLYFTPRLGIPFPTGSSVTIAGTTSTPSINGTQTVTAAGPGFIRISVTGGSGSITLSSATISYSASRSFVTLTTTSNTFVTGQLVNIGSVDTNIPIFFASPTLIQYYTANALPSIGNTITSVNPSGNVLPTFTNRQVMIELLNASVSTIFPTASTGWNNSQVVGTPYIVQSQSGNQVIVNLTTTITTAQLTSVTFTGGHLDYGNILTQAATGTFLNYATVGTPTLGSAVIVITAPSTSIPLMSVFEVGQTLAILSSNAVNYQNVWLITAVDGMNLTLATPGITLSAGASGTCTISSCTMPYGCIGIRQISSNGTTAVVTYNLPTVTTGSSIFPIGSGIYIANSPTPTFNGSFTVTASTSTTVSFASTTTATTSGGVITNGSTVVNVTGGNTSSTTLTLNFTNISTGAIPYPIGSWINVSGVTPSGYNGTWYVTNASSTSVTYTRTGGSALAWSSGGTISSVTNGAGTITIPSGQASYASNVATLVFSTQQPYVPFIVGQPIVIVGASPTLIDGTWTVISSSSTQIQVEVTATGSATINTDLTISAGLYTISTGVLATGTVTITYNNTTSTPVFSTGQTIQITGATPTSYNGNWVVTGTPASNTLTFTASSSITGNMTNTTASLGIALPITIGTPSPHGLPSSGTFSYNVVSNGLSYNLYKTGGSIAKTTYSILDTPTRSTIRFYPAITNFTITSPTFSVGPVLYNTQALFNNYPSIIVFPVRGYCLEQVASSSIFNSNQLTLFVVPHFTSQPIRGNNHIVSCSTTANTGIGSILGTYGPNSTDIGIHFPNIGAPRLQFSKFSHGQGPFTINWTSSLSSFRLFTAVYNQSDTIINDVPSRTGILSQTGSRSELSLFNGNNTHYCTSIAHIRSMTFSSNVVTVNVGGISVDNVVGWAGFTNMAGRVVTISGVNPTSNAVFQASISGTTMTVTSVISGTILVNMTLSGTGVSSGTTIVSGSGLSWVVSISQNVSSTNITGAATTGLVGNFTVLSGPTQRSFSYSFVGTPSTYVTGGTVVPTSYNTNFSVGHIRLGADPSAVASFSLDNPSPFQNINSTLSNVFYEGGIAEIIAFNSILTVEQRQLVEGFLSQKYYINSLLGSTSVISGAGGVYNITGGSAPTSTTNPTGFILTLTCTFSPANTFLIGSQITVAGATPSVYNGTWVVTASSVNVNIVTVSFFYPGSNPGSWSSGGTITGNSMSASASIHPYRLNPTTIASSLTLTNTYAQGLVAWFDAANASTIVFVSGNNINSWTSVGGSIANLSLTPNGTNYPTLVQNAQNGLPGVRFTVNAGTGTPLGTSFIYPITNFSTMNSNNEYTIITVYRQPTYTSSQTIAAVIGSTSNQRLMTYTNTFSYRNSTTEQIKDYIATTNGQTYIGVHYRRSNTMLARINGTQDAGSTTSGTNLNLSGLGNIFSLSLGAYAISSPTANPFAGDIYEHILFRYALTDQAIQQMEGYLAWKWGLQTSLPTTHPYYRIRP